MVTPRPKTEGRRGFRGLFLICADLQRSLEFYRWVGFELQERSQRSAAMSLDTSLSLHLHERLTPAEEQAYGVCWQEGGSGLVLLLNSSDIDKLWKDAPDEARAIAPTSTPWGDRILILRDPDGYRLEFRQEPS